MCLFVFLYSCSGGSDPKKLSALGNYGSSEPEEEDRPVREILTMTTVSPPAMLEFLEEAVKRFNAQNDLDVYKRQGGGTTTIWPYPALNGFPACRFTIRKT